jgi:hypothetical protein
MRFDKYVSFDDSGECSAKFETKMDSNFRNITIDSTEARSRITNQPVIKPTNSPEYTNVLYSRRHHEISEFRGFIMELSFE